MRPIDADEVNLTIKRREPHWPSGRTAVVAKITPKDLEAVPTIEAIPIEWLNEYAHKLIKLEQNQPVAYRWFSVLGENILQMIHDWRKEMGTFDDLLPNCVKHAKAMKEIENQLEERNGK